MEKLAESLGVTKLSKSQVSVMAAELDEMVTQFRSRPLDAGPYTFLWIDALTQKVREGGRTVNVHALIATGVNADGRREILGLDVATAEDGAGWLAFLRGLAARGLSGVQLVTSDCHHGLRDAIAAVLPGAAWQRCRAHYARNLATKVPKSAQPWVSTLVRTIFEQKSKLAELRITRVRQRPLGQARRSPSAHNSTRLGIPECVHSAAPWNGWAVVDEDGSAGGHVDIEVMVGGDAEIPHPASPAPGRVAAEDGRPGAPWHA